MKVYIIPLIRKKLLQNCWFYKGFLPFKNDQSWSYCDPILQKIVFNRHAKLSRSLAPLAERLYLCFLPSFKQKTSKFGVMAPVHMSTKLHIGQYIYRPFSFCNQFDIWTNYMILGAKCTWVKIWRFTTLPSVQSDFTRSTEHQTSNEDIQNRIKILKPEQN